MMAKQQCIKIHLNNTYDGKLFKTKEGVIKDGKARIGFTPLCVLKENKPRRAFYRSARQLILFVEGASNALHFTESTDEMQTHWTKEESRAFVRKLVALASVEVKPLKTWQFALIIILLFILIVVGVANLQKLASIGL